MHGGLEVGLAAPNTAANGAQNGQDHADDRENGPNGVQDRNAEHDSQHDENDSEDDHRHTLLTRTPAGARSGDERARGFGPPQRWDHTSTIGDAETRADKMTRVGGAGEGRLVREPR